MEDKAIIKGIKNSSYRDFTLLYERYFSKLYGFVFKLSRSETVAHEIVQETFISIWTNRSNLNSDSSIQSFLFTIARNKLLNHLRNNAHNVYLGDYFSYCDKIELSENRTSSQTDFDHFLKKIDIAKRKLTPRLQEIFELSKEQEFTLAEISAKLKISEQSVRNQLRAAILSLKENL